jgi:hypothetical protein
MDEAKSSLLVRPDEQPQFGREFCFLCGAALTTGRDTAEPVIPKWIQERYELWDQKLTLLNRTTIPYCQLEIPCCSICNSEDLGKIEADMQKACDTGRKAVVALPPLTLFLWAGKILTVSFTGASSEFAFRSISNLKFPLPSSSTRPWSRRIVRCTSIIGQPGGDSPLRSRGKSGHHRLLARRRRREVYIPDHYREFEKISLHWAQVAGVTARVFYDLTRIPKFMPVEGKDRVHVVLSPLGRLSGKPLFEEWEMEGYARMLPHCSRFPLEMIHPQPDKVISCSISLVSSEKSCPMILREYDANSRPCL